MNSEREDLLLSRVVDQRADAQDFDHLAQLASADPGVWERLGLTLRDHAVLRAAVGAALDPVLRNTSLPQPRRRAPLRLLRAACAVLVLGLVFVAGRLSAASAGDADRLFADYLRVGGDSGRVLQQLPVVPVSSRPGADGRSLELVFVRQLLERTVVDRAWQLGVNDQGQLTPAEVSVASYRQPSSF